MKNDHQSKKNKKKKAHRNAGFPGALPRKIGNAVARRRAAPPDWRTTLAAVIGGGGSAALSGLIVNQRILSPEASAIGMIGVGGATAYFADGNTRVVGNSIASAGAGQLALALLARRAMGKPPATATTAATPPAQAPAQLPAPAPAPVPAEAPAPEFRKDAFGGGYVTSLFRDAANELEMLDDEERMSGRDAGDGVDVYDLEDLAAA